MRYELIWYTHEGVRKGVIQAFTSLEYVKTQNSIGFMIVNLPRKLIPYSQFSVGDIFEIWREKDGVLSLQNETAYFLQNWEFYADADGREFIRLIASDANWLLDTAIVWARAGSADAKMTDIPDDMIKTIVNKQLGALATPADRVKLTCAPEVGLGGASITKEFAYRPVLTVIQEICETATENGIWLGFDVVRTNPGAFEFRTYIGQRGQNHGRSSGDPRLVGKQYGNFSEASFGEKHADERNVILAGGAGEENDRTLLTCENVTRKTASKWNRREYFKDSRTSGSTATLQAVGDATLDEYKPKQVLTGIVRDIPGMKFGIHYQFGDILSAEAFGYFVDCRVESVKVTVDQDNGEQLDIKLRGEL